ncbi:FAD-dependent oxidoreductase [Actinophytocola oryzae]|uniref:2-polyprenyl-6-methoxyphenol hydroxylase-like FAD-dependent oxidoreductase n=1 Tax=Actinophytocola oryzae TaxID=502181 RepID=A0A4R7W716_9PSEU|nr:FAD-dependent oxidoreductase [Actinophytocola oryzae]TDV57507.1 2-polyprenyl-6-methoxyphenol hydroxylase-like FAD-dependent oxidoreductase [Actinophytocola oryzae]
MGRVMIIGGGVAGCAAALAMDKAGHDVAVYEAHPDSGADIGAFLTLAGNGMFALTQLGAAEPVADLAFPLTSLRLTAATGEEVATAPLNPGADRLTRYQCLRRADLGRALRSTVAARGIPVHHGARLAAVDEAPGRVTARFGDGRTAEADLLVGADGLGSTVRPLLDPAVVAPRYVGQRVFYGYTTKAAPPTAPARIDMIRGSTAAFGYAVSPDGETYWFARVTDERLTEDEIAHGTPTGWRDQLVPLLRRDTTAAADIVAATDQLMVTNAHDLPDVPRWHTDRVLIIGDAAHAASPATGQGASMALEDAVVLAKSFRDTGSTTEALTTYERLRRPRVAANIAASAQLSTGPSRPGSPPVDEDELHRQLDWATPL